MQHKGQPFRGVRVFRTTSSKADRVGQHSLLLRVEAAAVVASHQGNLTPRPARAQHVQAHPCYHGGKPGSCVVNIVRLRAGKSYTFLDRIVGFAKRPEHGACHRAQMAGAPQSRPRLPFHPAIRHSTDAEHFRGNKEASMAPLVSTIEIGAHAGEGLRWPPIRADSPNGSTTWSMCACSEKHDLPRPDGSPAPSVR